ncbi:MAG: acetate--CoA ligase family protein [Chromatiales bacterium]|nr:acetate--CoA ligase family protein [Chromatiales bacterium]
MNFEEHAAKPLLRAAGIAVPRGRLARSAAEARAAAAEFAGPVVVKAQVPTGKRGKAGGIRTADTVEEAASATEAILDLEIAGHRVESVLIEERAAIAAEYYAAVLNDAATKGPLVMFSSVGGMDVEEVAASMPDRLRRAPVDITRGLDLESARRMLEGLGLGADEAPVAETLVSLYRAYRDNDAELLEVNPLARLEDGRLVALDCKFTLDDSGIKRREALARMGTPERLTGLEARGQALGLKYIELDGDIGVLANGAGLTMTTMDVITRHGGRPANFLEIGGEAYTKATPALELVLDNPRVRCLLVNFCGAFARTDVMTGGVIDAWVALAPSVPVFFSVHGTGSAEARAMLRERLGVTPFETMDEAVAAAVAASREAGGNNAPGSAGADDEGGADRSMDGDSGRVGGAAP